MQSVESKLRLFIRSNSKNENESASVESRVFGILHLMQLKSKIIIAMRTPTTVRLEKFDWFHFWSSHWQLFSSIQTGPIPEAGRKETKHLRQKQYNWLILIFDIFFSLFPPSSFLVGTRHARQKCHSERKTKWLKLYIPSPCRKKPYYANKSSDEVNLKQF